MSIRTRIHRPSPRPCEHHAIVPIRGHAGFGRCLECGTTIATPFTLHTN